MLPRLTLRQYDPQTDDGRIAYHEAAHAVIAHLVGIEVYSVEIASADGSLGNVKHASLPGVFGSEADRQRLHEHHAMVCVAGGMGERRYLDMSDEKLEGHLASLEDLYRAETLVRAAVGDDQALIDERLALIDHCVAELLDRHWQAVGLVAARLIECRTLTGAEIDECIATANGGFTSLA